MQQAVTNGDLSEIRQLINDFGASALDEREPSGLLPVMRAIFEGQIDSLQLLIDAGADLTACDPEDWNVLHVAAAMDDYEAAELIICSCKQSASMVQSENMCQERPIDLAENVEMARLLLHVDLTQFRQELEMGTQAISISASPIESEGAILQLVEGHCQKHSNCHSLNTFLKSNTPYDTLLHLAATKNYSRLAEYICTNQLMSTESRDKNGWTPLHVATYYSSVDVVLVLAEHNVNTNSLTNSFEKPSDLTEHELVLSVLFAGEQRSVCPLVL